MIVVRYVMVNLLLRVLVVVRVLAPTTSPRNLLASATVLVKTILIAHVVLHVLALTLS